MVTPYLHPDPELGQAAARTINLGRTEFEIVNIEDYDEYFEYYFEIAIQNDAKSTDTNKNLVIEFESDEIIPQVGYEENGKHYGTDSNVYFAVSSDLLANPDDSSGGTGTSLDNTYILPPGQSLVIEVIVQINPNRTIDINPVTVAIEPLVLNINFSLTMAPDE